MLYVNYRNIRIHQIQTFLAAAESCNYSMAAEKMNVTQSMVSKTIKFLEQETGLILFRKDHGKLYLTPAGKEASGHLLPKIKYMDLSYQCVSETPLAIFVHQKINVFYSLEIVL